MTELPVLQPKTCGTCTLCCKLLGIKELGKQPNEWCPHCAVGKGCKIYDTRPPSCREFECLWLQTPDMPDEYRPDRCKMVLAPTADGEGIAAYIEPHHRHLLRESKLAEMLRRLSQKGILIFAVIGEERHFLYSGRALPEKIKEKLAELQIGSIEDIA